MKGKHVETQTLVSGTTVTAKIQQLRRKVKLLRDQLFVKQKTLLSTRAQRNVLQKRLVEMESASKCGCQSLPKAQRDFIRSQQRAASSQKHGMRWTAADKRIGRSIYMKSPAAYLTVSKHFRMPHKSTLLLPLRAIFRQVPPSTLCSFDFASCSP